MNNPTNTRRAVAILANALRYQQNFTASAAWKKAWQVIKLKAAMKTGTVEFSYIKTDGSIRPATGTTASEITGYTPSPEAPARKYSPLNVRYFDTAANGFRQFAAARLQ